MVKYVLDTHAFLWAASEAETDRRKLGTQARRIIENAAPGELGISDATIIEIGQLLHTGRIDFGAKRAETALAPILTKTARLPIALNAAIAAPALALPHGDPHDRLIVATALDLGVPLITKDGNITDSDVVEVIW